MCIKEKLKCVHLGLQLESDTVIIMLFPTKMQMQQKLKQEVQHTNVKEKQELTKQKRL